MPKLTKKQIKAKLRGIPELLDEIINSTSNLQIKIALVGIRDRIKEVLEGS